MCTRRALQQGVMRFRPQQRRADCGEAAAIGEFAVPPSEGRVIPPRQADLLATF